jgi:hypothetical protein
MTRTGLLSGLLMIAVSAPAFAQENSCVAQESDLARMNEEFLPEQDDIKVDADELKNDAPGTLEIKGEVIFVDAHVALHLPQVTMKNRKIAFDVPQTTSRLRRFSWSVPEVRMENRVIGRYPQFTCNWRGCRTRWRDIVTKIPVTRMVRKDASTNVPEFRMDRREFVTAMPEVKLVRKDMYYKMPQITVKNPLEEQSRTQVRSEQLQKRGSQLSDKMKARSIELSGKLFDCHRDSLMTKRDAAAQSFEQGITQLNGAIEFIRSQGADPAAFVPEEPGAARIDLIAQRDQLLKDRDKALAEMDKAIADMSNGASGLVADAPIMA